MQRLMLTDKQENEEVGERGVYAVLGRSRRRP